MVGPKITLQLERFAETVDAGGGLVQSWSFQKYIKGVFTSSSGRESYSNNKRVVDSTHLFFCDYFSDITLTEKDRFKYGARILEILYVDNPQETNSFFRIYLKEEV